MKANRPQGRLQGEAMTKVRFMSYPSLVGITLRQKLAHETYEKYFTMLHEPLTFDELCEKVWHSYESPNPATPRPPMANEIAYGLIRLIDAQLVYSFDEEEGGEVP